MINEGETQMNGLCGEEELQRLIEAIADDARAEEAEIDARLAQYPDDHRLHFLKGSVLAGKGRAIEAHLALAQAVSLAPDFEIARFQLGFFELTSGDLADAKQTWQPLLALDDSHHLKRFVVGLAHLVEDRFEEAIADLRKGMELNRDNLPLNGDMQLLIDKCQDLLKDNAGSSEEASQVSATSLFMGQLSGDGTRH